MFLVLTLLTSILEVSAQCSCCADMRSLFFNQYATPAVRFLMRNSWGVGLGDFGDPALCDSIDEATYL